MIYCNLKGGLGNMLFQIATAKSLSIDNKTECCFRNLISHLNNLDNDMFFNPKLKHSHEYLSFLNNLNFNEEILESCKYINYPFEYVESDKYDYDILIDGFFQSEKYFKHNRNEIINYLNFKIFDEIISNKYNFIHDNIVTSIHIRRGDFINLANHHPVQTIEYYSESINKLENKTDIFLIFSDDIDWCKQNFKGDKFIFIENEKDYIEICLMSKCVNNIISNSSFSWWGAWLNENNDKIVIGPSRWFGDAIQHNTGDILPENWIKI